MRTIFLFLTASLVFLWNNSNAQFWKDIKESVEEALPIEHSSGLTEDEVGKGLKEALVSGINNGVDQLSKPDGYFKDLTIKILMPEEAKKVESTLRNMGLGSQVDEAIESMNRAAENAAEGARDIFITAIKDMSFKDAMNILTGENNAATDYLDIATRPALTEKFEPVIQASLEKVNATKYWNTVFTSYNKVPFVKKVDPDLEAYVTEKALDGLFVQIAKQEENIRKNPGARTTDLLKKVFSRDQD